MPAPALHALPPLTRGYGERVRMQTPKVYVQLALSGFTN